MSTKKIINCEIIINDLIAPEHYYLEINASYKFVNPGQFVMLKIHSEYDPFLRIPLGIHTIKKDKVGFLYRVVGTATSLLSQKKPGDKLNILGPLGNGFTIANSNNAVLVAGGHGVAPLYFLAQQLKKNKTTIIIGAKTKALVIGVKQFQVLGVKVEVVTEDGSTGQKGLVTDILANHLEPNAQIYACGPNPMLKAIANMANKAGIPAQLSLEAYMACGIGVCRGCAIKIKDSYKMCCQDGPVFTAEELA